MGEENKVYVSNLPFQTSEDELRDAFEKAGPVKDVNIITDRETGRGKGFGFVTFEDATGAKNAIETLNETDLNGRNIRVNEAQPRGPRGGGGRGYGGGGGGGGGGYSRGSRY